jgi:hypothetical protein
MPYDRIRERDRDDGRELEAINTKQLARAREWEATMAESRKERLLAAVIAIWSHTETHTTYKPGAGYRWQTGDPPCSDPALHMRLSIEEGEAWHAYRRSLR